MKIIKILVDRLPVDCLMECPLKYNRAGCGKFIDDHRLGGGGTAVYPGRKVHLRGENG